MIYIACDCRIRLLPTIRRTFVHTVDQEPTEHRIWIAAWLTFMVARTNKALSDRMLTLLRKSAKEIVSLDNLKGKIWSAVEKRVNRRMQWHDEEINRHRKENSDLHARNNKLYQENCEMRAAIRTFNKVVQL
jgi:hypothetical protein